MKCISCVTHWSITDTVSMIKFVVPLEKVAKWQRITLGICWVSVSFASKLKEYTGTQRGATHAFHNIQSCRQAVPTLSPPQCCCCSASELPSSRLCVFPPCPSEASSRFCITPKVLSQGDPESGPWPSGDSVEHATGEVLSAGISKAFFSWILLLISFWNLHICSCSSLMKFTTV